MKRIFLLSLLLMMFLPLLRGQAPQKMTAQMVLRDANGLLVTNQAVAVRVSIRRTTATGITVYKETHSATTNANGLYTIFVGSGTPEVGTFSAIDWGQGPYFIVSEVDPAGGTNYTLQTTQQLVSVPYALYTDSANRCAEHQVLSISHDTLFLTGGSFVRLPSGVSRRYVDSVNTRIDSLRHVSDSMINVMRWRIDSLVAAGGGSTPSPTPTPTPTPNPSCVGLNTTGSASVTSCDRYVWAANGQTYTASATPTATIYGGNSVGCDSTVTLTLTIKQGTYNVYNQTSSDSYTWHGTAYSATGTYTYTYTNSVGCPSVDTLHLVVSSTPTPVAGCSCAVASNDGTLPKLFSVSATKKVKFSRGNLQYQASTNTWRFALCQKQYMDTLNKNISATYTGWIDLFGWGTSGFHNPADANNTHYYPYSTGYPRRSGSTTNHPNYYGYGPSYNLSAKNLTDGSYRYDWGVYNAISNGGNVAGAWRTLTSAEWTYLLKTRTVRSSGMTGTNASAARFCKANVAGVNGMIIFPDTTLYPSSLPNPVGINDSTLAYANNYFDDAQWTILESVGAVFLPAAGIRSFNNASTYSNGNSYGYYWLSTAATTGSTPSANAMYICFGGGNSRFINASSRFLGFSVRLVKDI